MADWAELLDQMGASDAYRRVSELRLLDLSAEIFLRNAKELKDLLIRTRDFEWYVEMWSLQNRIRLHDFQTTILQKLHNLVASQFSMVQHTQRICRQPEHPEAFIEAYQEQLKRRFVSDPIACLVKDLRRYFQHYGVAPLTCNISFGDNSESPETVLLPRDSLLAWADWTRPARDYLAAQGEALVDDRGGARESGRPSAGDSGVFPLVTGGRWE